MTSKRRDRTSDVEILEGKIMKISVDIFHFTSFTGQETLYLKRNDEPRLYVAVLFL
jgi:hypothetical protein